MENDYSFAIFIAVAINIAVLITFFAMASRIKKIKALLQKKETNYYKMYWYERELGNNDKAYEYVLRYYLEKMFDAHTLAEASTPGEAVHNRVAKMCEAIGKPVPDFEKLGVNL